MANKIAAPLLLFLLFAQQSWIRALDNKFSLLKAQKIYYKSLTIPARAELLKLSLLEKPAPAFTLKLDIFNGAMSSSGDSRPGNQQEIQPAQVAAGQKTIAEEIFQSISYEGYVIKNAKKSALLNVSGEFFMVSEQDQILEKIKIIKISKNVVTIEYENQPYDIKIKGDENG